MDQTKEKALKILILGNSASNDIFFQLGRVFKAQGFGKPYVLGFLYHSGCQFQQHVGYFTQNEYAYDYYKTSDTTYQRVRPSTMEYALRDEPWDIVFLQPGGTEDILHSDFQRDSRRKIEAYVNENVPNAHEFGFHLRCPNPNDPEIWGEGWPVHPPEGYREKLTKCYGFDPENQFRMTVEACKANILTDPTYKHCICTGAGMFYAQKVLGVPQTSLYRDYTHLHDFGRVLTAYCFYAQLMGEPIDEVKLDLVPATSRQKRYQAEGDLVLTSEQKRIIKESANYALEHPWDPITK